jgi:hypothetical protein
MYFPLIFKSIPKFGTHEEMTMNNIIYIIGLVVVVVAVLAFFGLR